MNPDRRLYFLLLFFVSGACGLIYEIVWSRLLAFVFGGTTFAITTVLACFMGGLAAGSYLAGSLSRRVAKPARMYGILEICIGVYCLSVPLLLDMALPLYQVLARASGGSFLWLTVARVVVCGAILLVPTAAMGATLPLLSKAFSRSSSDVGDAVARLYGFNTIGAFVGCAGAGFFLLPRLGLTGSIVSAAVLNVGAGTLAIVLSRGSEPAPETDASPKPARKKGRDRAEVHDEPIDPKLLLWLYGFSGFAAMAYQVSWTRALILSIGASTYAFTMIVACFILGLALGSLVIAARIRHVRRPLRLAGYLELLIGLSALVVAPLFGEMPGLVARILEAYGGSFGSALALELLCVLGLLIIPTLAMGALMPLVCMVYESAMASRGGNRREDSQELGSSAGSTVGNVYASNTAGTILGTVAAGFILIPAPMIGMQHTILIASVVSGVIGTVFMLGSAAPAKRPVGAVVVLWLVGIAVAVGVPGWSKTVLLSGPYLGRGLTDPGEVLFYREGVDTTVAVTTSREGYLSLRINGKTDASSGPPDMPTQVLASHIPMMLRPDAKNICVIGLGSGITIGVALAHPVERLDVVEISAAVAEGAQFFSAHNGDALSDPRTVLHRADGRNFLMLEDRSFDIVISEPSNPWISGIANLYTREFMELARSRLNPGGIHCQWIHAYSMSEDDFASVVATMLEVFPHIQVWETTLDDYLIVGSEEPLVLDPEAWYFASQRPAVRRLVGAASIHDPAQLAYHYIAEGEDLGEWLSGRRPLTDDLPRLEFSAPRHLLERQGDRIALALNTISGRPELAGGPETAINQQFLRMVNRRRMMRITMHEAIEAFRSVDWEIQDHLLEIADLMPDDGRVCLFLFRTVRAMQQSARGTAQTRVGLLGREIVARAPCVREMATAQSPSDLSWPLGERIVTPASPDLEGIIERSERLYRDGLSRDAIDAMARAARDYPNQPDGLATVGVWVLETDGPDRAIPYLLSLWMMTPDDPETNYQLARAYALRDDPDRALPFLYAAIANGFTDRSRLEADDLLTPLRDDPRFEELLDRLA